MRRPRVLEFGFSLALVAGLTGCMEDTINNPAASAPYFVEPFGGGNLRPGHLQDLDLAFVVGDGSIRRAGAEPSQSRNRHYMTTIRSDYLAFDWTYEITFQSPAGGPDDILFIGLGTGQPGSFYNEPESGIHFRIHRGLWYGDGWRVDIAADDIKWLETIGYLTPEFGEEFIARIRKHGNSLEFSITGASPLLHGSIPDLRAVAPYLDDSNTRLYFGNACGFYSFETMKVMPAAGGIGNSFAVPRGGNPDRRGDGPWPEAEAGAGAVGMQE